jgi:hypothetical protein
LVKVTPEGPLVTDQLYDSVKPLGSLAVTLSRVDVPVTELGLALIELIAGGGIGLLMDRLSRTVAQLPPLAYMLADQNELMGAPALLMSTTVPL